MNTHPTPEKIAEELAEKCAEKLHDCISPGNCTLTKEQAQLILTTLNLKELVEDKAMLEHLIKNKLIMIESSQTVPLRQAIKAAMERKE